MTYKSYDNTGNMLRSIVKASTNTEELPWMVPTIPQYEVALSVYLEYDSITNPVGINMVKDKVEYAGFFTGALLSSSRLAVWGISFNG